MRRDAYLRFYLDPRRIARIWSAHPRHRNLIEYGATMFLRDALRIDVGRWLNKLSGRAGANQSEPLAVQPPAPPPPSTPAPAMTPSSQVVQLRRRIDLAQKASESGSRA